MGFYLRKSVSVGPFRFNLSGSGIGISAGFRGFRVGTGPRGNYVRIGRGLVRYQQTIPSGRPIPPRLAPPIPSGTHAPLEEIESAEAAQIVDSSSEELIAEIRAKRRALALMPFAIFAAVALVLGALAAAWPDWVVVVAMTAGVAAIVAASLRDRLVKTTVIVYELEPGVEAALRTFTEWGDALASARKVWHVAASGQVYDRKYHAGASALVQRHPTWVRTAQPPLVKTNVPVLGIGVGRQTLYFLPDRLLIYDARDAGAVSYRTLDITAGSQRFIEDGGVPSDATVAGHTWRYVNRNGGPDRRFNNNPQLPICVYDELAFRTQSGLNEIVQVSRSGVAGGFAAAVRQLASVVA